MSAKLRKLILISNILLQNIIKKQCYYRILIYCKNELTEFFNIYRLKIKQLR